MPFSNKNFLTGGKPFPIQQIRGDGIKMHNDVLAVEEPLEMRLVSGTAEARSERSISITMRTPGNDLELAAGFFYTEGIIQ